jgi:hypothetical protein
MSQAPLPPLDPSEVNWAATTHAYGPATDIPDILSKLESDEKSERKNAMWELYGNVWHQGSRYPATVLIVPFLVRLAANPTIKDRDQIALFIPFLALGHDTYDLPDGVDIFAWRERLEKRRNLDIDDEKRRLDQWVSEAVDEGQRQYREWKRRIRESLRKRDLNYMENGMAAYIAVRDKALPTLCSIVQSDPDSMVRAAAAHTLAFYPESAQETMPLLHAIVFDDSEDVLGAFRGTAIISFTILYAGLQKPELDRQVLEERLRHFLSNENILLSWSAATGLARLGIYDSTVIRILAEITLNKEIYKEEHSIPFHGGETAAYALLSLQKAFDTPSVPDSALSGALGPILHGLESDTYYFPDVFVMACRILWKTPENNPLQGSNPIPFERLSTEEKALLKSLAEQKNSYWSRQEKLRKSWNFPQDRDECRRYVGLPEEGPYQESSVTLSPAWGSDEEDFD